jgi:hypothetical protein
MDFTALLESLQYSDIAQWVNTGGVTYPIVESLHVLAVAMVFGTILICACWASPPPIGRSPGWRTICCT